MVDNKIMEIKRKVLDFMEQEAGKYGNARMDTKQMGELADIVKDLAEAEYYCSVSEAMGGQQDTYGYTNPTGGRMMGYGGQGGGGSMGGSRAGYGGNMMGHSDPASAIRDILMSADPETKAMLRKEIGNMLM
jgi:hypothetical protein